MGKLRVMSGAEVCLLLHSYGFNEVRRRGSHIIMQLSADNTTISIPVPDHKELTIGTLQSIIRQSGLPRRLFES